MSIEFLCPSCQQQLRVPDTAAGKNARCPKCSSILSVPASTASASPLAPPPQAGFDFSAPKPSPPPVPKPAPQGASPFGDAPASNPFAFTDPRFPATTQATLPPPQPQFTAAPNPYASPQGGYQVQRLATPGMIGHQVVEVSPIVNHAIEVWKRNLSVGLGMAVLPMVIMIPMMILMFVGAAVTAPMEEPALTIGVMILGYFLLILSQTWLGIGQCQMSVRMARGQQVQLSELFGGGDRLLPVLGFALVTTPIMIIAALPLYIPLIFLLLVFWPSYHLIVDHKCGVMDSFGLARQITEGNKLTTFVLVLVSYGFALLGELACFVGLLFAIPLISLMWSTAYLMMSGQLPIPPRPQPYYPQHPGYPQQGYPQQGNPQQPQGYLPPPQK